MGIVKRERRSGSKLLVPHAPIEGVDQGPMSVISLSWDSFFVRPGAVSSSRPASFTEAPRAAAVKAGRRCVVTTSSGIWQAMPWRQRARRKSCAVGAKGRAVSSTTSFVLDWAVIDMRKAPHNLVSGRAW